MSRRPSFFEPRLIKSNVIFFDTDKVKPQVLALDILSAIRKDESLTNEELTIALIQVLANVDANGIIADRLSDVFAFKRSTPSPSFQDESNVSRDDFLHSPTPFNTPIIKPKVQDKEIPQFKLQGFNYVK